MPLKNQLLDDLGNQLLYNNMDIPPGAPFECSTVVWPSIDTPLVYPTGTIDVSNYAAVAMVMAGPSVNLNCAVECSMTGLAWVPAFGWPIQGGIQTQPNFSAPTATPAQGNKNTVYIFPLEHANLFRIKVRFLQSGTVFFNIGLLDRVPFIPGSNLTARDFAANFWSYKSPTGGLITNSPITIRASSGSGLANYLSSLQIINVHASVGTEYTITDNAGANVMHLDYLPAAMKNKDVICFNPPVKGTDASPMILTPTTSGAQIYVSAQGYKGGS